MSIRYIIPAILLFSSLPILPVQAQEDFFLDDWNPRSIESPEFIENDGFDGLPETTIKIDASTLTSKVNPNLFGYCLNSFYGIYFDQQNLLQDIRNLDGSIYRMPAGSGSNYYFWNRSNEDGIPSDANLTKMKAGIGSDSYMSLQNYYRLIKDSLKAQSVIVVNYSYARYGTSDDPVAVAAGYAADWVRHDSGKTRYWEIGNENYGSWEEGYQIDISKNKDGQPEFQTGKLYGQHFRVFADSMRKAADDIGAQIKIGAVGYWGTLWPGSREQWNRQMIPECGDVCDFVSIHHYFNATGKNQILQTAYSMNEGPEQIYQWFDNNALPRVPIALTEWNLNKDISKPNCLNGMHAILGLKNLITSGIGMASRWNLVWNYNEGKTHGLFSTNRDFTTEKNRAWGPRAPFYYLYFARRFMGDVMLANTIQGNNQIESIVTSFSSGQVGAVLVNKGDSQEKVNLSINGFNAGTRYYWYELKGAYGDPSDEKVVVNGITSGESFLAGGPEQYESIPAMSGLISNGVEITLGPNTTGFILVEGTPSSTPDKQISFQVMGQDHLGKITPLNDASILLGSQAHFTDSMGMVNFYTHTGDYSLTIEKEGYSTLSSSITLINDTLILDTLLANTYDVRCFVREIGTETPIEDCLLKIEDTESLTDSEGAVMISNVPAQFNILLSKEHFFPVDGMEFSIWQDTTLILYMEKERYRIEFHLSDLYSGKGLWNAKVIINMDSAVTNQNGDSYLQLEFGTHDYSLMASDYHSQTGTIDVISDSSFFFLLEASAADVKFKLLKGTTPVNNANIFLGETSLITNSLGLATFSTLPASVNYNFNISRNGFDDVMGSFYLRTDTTIQVEMSLMETGLLGKFNQPPPMFLWPNPADETLFLEWEISPGWAYLYIFDSTGRRIRTIHQNLTKKNSIKVGELESGLYNIIIQTSEQVWNASFVK